MESQNSTMALGDDGGRSMGSTSRDAPARGVVVVAASAGGIEATQRLLRRLPRDLPAAIVVVQHRTPSTSEVLVSILRRASEIPTKLAQEGDALRAGVVYVAPSHAHVTIRVDHKVHLVSGPRVCYVLSAADPLFESAADAYGDHVVAIVLTGGNGDGTEGARAVAQHGGTVIAQDPRTADVPSMPRSAIASGAVRHVLAIDDMPAEIVRATQAWTDGGTGKTNGAPACA
jgi:two-component system chemotaxis response regulator CheB